MGYRIQEQSPWGAAELIAVGSEHAGGPSVPSSGNDSTATEGMRPDLYYGASDPRTPAGAAIGY
jgi:gamma-glutamyltranspeptidase/glutathione hydrolase